MSSAEDLVHDKDDWIRLGHTIRNRREALGLATRRELAKATRLSYRLLGDLERGNRRVSDETLALVERELKWQSGSTREILRGGEPTELGHAPELDHPGPADIPNCISEAFGIATEVFDLGHERTGNHLTRILCDITQLLKHRLPQSDAGNTSPAPTSTANSKKNSHPTVLGIALGQYLRKLRVEHGMTTVRVCEVLGFRPEDIWLLEAGYMHIDKGRIGELLTLYGRTEENFQKELIEAITEADRPGLWAGYDSVLPDWIRGYLHLEQSAQAIRTFEANYIPGLLQTTDYAQSIISFPHGAPSTPAIEKRIRDQLNLRMDRKKILDRLDAPHFWAIIGESAIREALAGVDVVRNQIVHLIEMSQKKNVVIQILPREYHALAGFAPSFSLINIREAIISDIVYTEQFTSALYLEKKKDVDEYRSLLDLIAVKALTPAESEEFLRRLARTLTDAKDRRLASTRGEVSSANRNNRHKPASIWPDA